MPRLGQCHQCRAARSTGARRVHKFDSRVRRGSFHGTNLLGQSGRWRPHRCPTNHGATQRAWTRAVACGATKWSGDRVGVSPFISFYALQAADLRGPIYLGWLVAPISADRHTRAANGWRLGLPAPATQQRYVYRIRALPWPAGVGRWAGAFSPATEL